MTEILSWIKNIVFFLILISAVVNCIANNTYKRYIVFFLGMVLIVIVIMPLSKITSDDKWLDHFYEIDYLKQSYNNYQIDMNRVNTIKESGVLQAYENEIKYQIESVVKSEGLKVKDIELSIDTEFVPERIVIHASYNDEVVYFDETEEKIVTREEVRIKDNLNQLYQIDTDNITIYIN